MSPAPPVHSQPSPHQARTEAALKDAGLDVFHWFSVADVNSRLDESAQLPDHGKLGLLVGNSRALWEPFHQWHMSHRPSANPLDDYVEQITRRALTGWSVRWLAFSHSTSGPTIPIQRYADAARFVRLGPAGLCIHPQYGPWMALRAVAILESREHTELSTPTLQHPCMGCHEPCVTALASALQDKRANLRRFLPVREACPVGPSEKYSDAQIDFHYNRPA